MTTITFENRDEVLQLIERRDELMDYFTREGAMSRCPLIDQNMKNSKFIARGAGGEVRTFILGVPGDTKQYVVKKVRNNGFKRQKGKVPMRIPENFKDGVPLWFIANFHAKSPEFIPQDLTIAVNGGDKDKLYQPGGKYLLAAREAECKLYYPLTMHKKYYALSMEGHHNKYTFFDTKKSFTYPANSYLCSEEAYPEYTIGLLCARLAEQGKCANFIDIIGFSMCTQKPGETTNQEVDEEDGEEDDGEGEGDDGQTRIYDYTFMEKIHGSIRKRFTEYVMNVDNPEEMVDSIIIQTYFGVSAMQRILGIQHNDLHDDNIMFQDIARSKNEGHDVKFGGETLADADYFSYEIDGTMIYFKNYGLIAKIADFGFAMKYSRPFIGRMDVAQMGYKIIPGWRDDYYDMTFSANHLFGNFGDKSRMLSKLYAKMLDPFDSISNEGDTVETVYKRARVVQSNLEKLYANGRPNFVGLARHAWEYLVDPDIMGPYLIKPKGNVKIVSLGSLKVSDYHPEFAGVDSQPLKSFTIDDIRQYQPPILDVVQVSRESPKPSSSSRKSSPKSSPKLSPKTQKAMKRLDNDLKYIRKLGGQPIPASDVFDNIMWTLKNKKLMNLAFSSNPEILQHKYAEEVRKLVETCLSILKDKGSEMTVSESDMQVLRDLQTKVNKVSVKSPKLSPKTQNIIQRLENDLVEEDKGIKILSRMAHLGYSPLDPMIKIASVTKDENVMSVISSSNPEIAKHQFAARKCRLLEIGFDVLNGQSATNPISEDVRNALLVAYDRLRLIEDQQNAKK